MFSFRRTLILAITLSAIALCGPLSCSSTSKQTKGESKQKAKEQPDKGLDAEVAELTLGGRVPLLFKVHPNRLDQTLAPALATLLQDVGGPGVQTQLDRFKNLGLIMFAADVLSPGDYVSQIDRERPSYLLRRVIADDSYFTAIDYGAVFQPDEVLPTAIHTRYLLPTDDPEALAEKMRAKLQQRSLHKAKITAAKRFVRLDVVRMRPGVDVDAAFAAATEIDDSDVKVRKTPALARFGASEAPVSVYLRSADFRDAFAAEGMFEAREAFASASPEFKQRILARGGAMGFYALMLAPSSEMEHEDSVAELAGDGAGGVVLDATSTLTSRGQWLSQVAGAGRALSEPVSADAKAQSVGTVRWNYDLLAVSGKAGADKQGRTVGPVDLRAFREGYRSGGWAAYVETLLISPTLAFRAIAAELPGRADPIVPAAGVVRVDLVKPDETRLLRKFGADGTLFFQDPRAKKVAVPLYQNYVARLGFKLIPDVEAAGDQGIHIGFRTHNVAQSDKEKQAEFDAALIEADVDLAPVVQASGQDELAKRLAQLTRVKLRWAAGEQVSRLRLHMGTGELEEPTVAHMDDFQPKEAAPPCVADVALAAKQTFEALETIRSSSSGKELLDILAGYDDLADKCAQKAPAYAEELKLARARMRDILRFRIRAGAENTAGAAIRKNACDLGDEIQCD